MAGTDQKRCITFAGAAGSSKTPIANYLSSRLPLPVFNTDAIRTEVTEDLGHLNTTVYDQRRQDRLDVLLTSDSSFIYDTSIDRRWLELQQQLKDYGYRYFVISLDLSLALLGRLYAAKGYTQDFAAYHRQHEQFLVEYGDVARVHITDDSFPDRLEIAYQATRSWLNDGR